MLIGCAPSARCAPSPASGSLAAVPGRAVLVGSVATGALALCGCGSSTTTTTTTTGGSVQVQVTSPTSGAVINADSVTVRGTINPPNGSVQVQGQPAAVGNGVFTASARLHGGKTTIDVVGSAPGLAPGSTTVVITRQSSGGAAKSPANPFTPTPGANSGGSQSTGGTAYQQPSGRTSCGGGLSVGPNTTCSFADNVRAAYANSGPGSVSVYSPVTGQTYAMTCEPTNGEVICTGANNASVYFPG